MFTGKCKQKDCGLPIKYIPKDIIIPKINTVWDEGSHSTSDGDEVFVECSAKHEFLYTIQGGQLI